MNAPPLARVARLHTQDAPDRTALQSSTRLLTYRELDRRADQVARGLWASGAYGGRKVAAVLNGSFDFYELCIGVARAGAILVPISSGVTGDVLLDLLKDCRPRALFIDAESFPLLEPIRLQLYFIELIVVAGRHFKEWRSGQAESAPDISPYFGNTMMQVYVWDGHGQSSPVKFRHESLLRDYLLFDYELRSAENQSDSEQETVELDAGNSPIQSLIASLAGLARGARVLIDG